MLCGVANMYEQKVVWWYSRYSRGVLKDTRMKENSPHLMNHISLPDASVAWREIGTHYDTYLLYTILNNKNTSTTMHVKFT